MNKKRLLLKSCTIYFFLLPVVCLAQIVVKGNVFSKDDGQPIIGASVFYDGTTLGTITDDKGYFELTSKKRLNNTLVIKYLGYKTVYLIGLNSSKIRVNMEENVTELSEVVLESDTWSRRKKERVFLREFLGEGHDCEIINLNDVRLYYQKSEKILHAYGDKPILILNKKLQYEIIYHLSEFETKFEEHPDTGLAVSTTYFKGESQFKDQEPNPSIKVVKLRNRMFEGSAFHFFRAMYQLSIKNEGFKLFYPSGAFLKPVKPKKAYRTKIKDGLMEVAQNYRKVVIYYEKEQSVITSIQNPFTIDAYGFFYPPKKFVISGAMSKNRIGQMLPSDFEMQEPR